MSLSEILTVSLSIVNALGITFGGLWLRREAKRLKAAEAAQIETNNAILAGNEWKKIAEQASERLSKKENKIDRLYNEITGWRDKYHQSITECHELKLGCSEKEYRLCQRRNCPDREPQTGF